MNEFTDMGTPSCSLEKRTLVPLHTRINGGSLLKKRDNGQRCLRKKEKWLRLN